MTPIAELSPVDPSTGNQFNPRDPTEPKNPLGISVEDVQSYREFIFDQFRIEKDDDAKTAREVFRPFLDSLTKEVHPLALGNVHRVHQQIKQLAKKLLEFHPDQGRNLDDVIAALTTGFYSHLHMINRYEAREILGEEQVEFASDDLAQLLDELLRAYESDFALRRSFYLMAHLGDDQTKDARFIGAALDSKMRSYLFETKVIVRQHSALPPNVQFQLPSGQAMPLVPGLPREYQADITSEGWVSNPNPIGVTL